MAIIKFKVFDESLLRIRFGGRSSYPETSFRRIDAENEWPIFPGQETGLERMYLEFHNRTRFLEKGINRDFLESFDKLTARVGINNRDDWEYIYEHGPYWGPPNWTKENALFCYDILIDAIIKNQQSFGSFTEVEFHRTYIIEVSDELYVYDKDRNIIFTIEKGKQYRAAVFGRSDNQWEIYNETDAFIVIYIDSKSIIGRFDHREKEKFKFIKTILHTFTESSEFKILEELQGG
jgi:hypothetical protein